MPKQQTRRGQTQKDVQNQTSLSRLFTSPLAGEDARRAGEGYKNKVILDLIQDLQRNLLLLMNDMRGRFRIKYGMTSLFNKGFTLIELLVAIMIIGILAAVAVPQYQKAVMKSRFAAMMPIAKTLANANEVYYAEHDEYSTDPAKLNVTPQAGTPDGTAINMYSNPEEVSFVRVENPGVPNARYVVYQKLSENFPETTWCEAGDTRTEELCVALGGTLPEGLTGNSSGDNTTYKAYLLTGLARSGDSFAETGTETPTEPEPPACPENSVCDEQGNVTGCNTGYKLSEDTCVEIPPCQGVSCDDNGNITECASGKTLHNGSCEDCATAFPGAATCSATSYAPLSCSTGYNLTNNACVEAPACPTGSVCNAQGTVTNCNTGYYLSEGTCAAVGGCPASMSGSTTAESHATCTQVCDNTDDPACYKWTGGQNSYSNTTGYPQIVCYAGASYDCAGVTFSGRYICEASAANGCGGGSFNGGGAFCSGAAANACAGSTFQAGSYCSPTAAGGCDNVKYGATGNAMGFCKISGIDNCPIGVPTANVTDPTKVTGYDYTWKGNCCNPAYMASGECPSGITVCAN